jgi:Sep-tRNA:Cys-tRNA synthetase
VVESVPKSNDDFYSISPEGYSDAIKSIQERGGNVALALLTYPDGSYGNLVDAKAVSKICHDEGVPFLLNGAYSVGRMPVSARDLGADMIVASGHKSMASCGPIGLLGADAGFASRIFRKSKSDPGKELELLGCTLRGAGLLTMMASFPHVVERVKKWGYEVEKARWFAAEMESMGIVLRGDRPHNHDLMFFVSSNLYEISRRVKKGRYFLYNELKSRNIFGIKPGLTRQFKLSTYMLSEDDLRYVLDSFSEIISKYAEA